MLLTGHLLITTGVVRNGAVSVGSKRNAQRSQHPHRGDADAVKTQEEFLLSPRRNKRDQNRHDDRGEGSPCTLHPGRHAGNDHGRGPGDRLLGDLLGRGELVACVILGGKADDVARDQTGQDRDPNAPPSHPLDGAEQQQADQQRSDRNKAAASIDPRAKGVQQLPHGRIFLGTHEIDADDRKEDPDPRQDHRS